MALTAMRNYFPWYFLEPSRAYYAVIVDSHDIGAKIWNESIRRVEVEYAKQQYFFYGWGYTIILFIQRFIKILQAVIINNLMCLRL